QSRRRIAGDDPSRDRACDLEGRFDASSGQDLFDLIVGPAKNPNSVLRGPEIALGGLLIRRCQIDVLLRGTASLHESGQPRQRPLLQLESARRRQQRRFRLQQVRAVDRKEDIALPDVIADIVEGLYDLALVLGEYLNLPVLVEVDSTDRGLEYQEIAHRDRLDLEL